MMTEAFASILESAPISASVENRADGGCGRVVVLVPDVWEAALLASRIHEVAAVRGQDVLLLGMISELQSEAAMRRKLTLLSAFLLDAGTRTEVRVKEGQAWVRELDSLLGDDDLLAWCDSDGVSESAKAWEYSLGGRLTRPIYVFADRVAAIRPTQGLLRRLAPWFGSLAIILGFLWLQLSLTRLNGPATTSPWLIASVPAEMGMIWLLNALLA